MIRNNIDKIKSFEAQPKIVEVFSDVEIGMMQDLYKKLPERVFY